LLLIYPKIKKINGNVIVLIVYIIIIIIIYALFIL